MTLQDPLHRKPQSPNHTVFLDGSYCIVRACRIETTAIGQQGREYPLIDPDWEDEYLAKHASILLVNLPLDN